MNTDRRLCAAEARLAPESGIVAVVNYGRGRHGLIPLWAGEGDLPTPEFISRRPHTGCGAARPSTPGSAAFRNCARRSRAITSGISAGRSRATEFLVTGGGMQAIQLAMQATGGRRRRSDLPVRRPGRTSPAPQASPAREAGRGAAGLRRQWLDLRRRQARGGGDRAHEGDLRQLALNPTGWTADVETLRAILDLARRKDLWIIADEIYALFHYGGGSARRPSWTSWSEEDRILFVNTFSKNWAMTGWRIGWLRAHPALRQQFENLDPVFDLGRGAVHAARRRSRRWTRATISWRRRSSARRQARDHRLRHPRRNRPRPLQRAAGRVLTCSSRSTASDSRRAAFDIVDQANVGLAPGTAFGRAAKLPSALLPPPPRPGRRGGPPPGARGQRRKIARQRERHIVAGIGERALEQERARAIRPRGRHSEMRRMALFAELPDVDVEKPLVSQSFLHQPGVIVVDDRVEDGARERPRPVMHLVGDLRRWWASRDAELLVPGHSRRCGSTR